MTLTEGKTGRFYQISKIAVSASVAGRLEAMGIRNGAVIELLNHRKNGAAIVYVRGTRIALGKTITDCMTVSEVSG